MTLGKPARADPSVLTPSRLVMPAYRKAPCDSPRCKPHTGAEIRWEWHRFEDLTAELLHRILRLRQQIFIVEQNVACPDIDGRDPSSDHLVGQCGQDVVAYMRTLPRSLFTPDCFSLGRVVVDERYRRSGIGSELVRRGLHHLDAGRADCPIRISSQLYLKDFYASFGFVPRDMPYVEDQILHIEMIRP